MKLKNYTTQVSVPSSLNRIEQKLIEAGATNISKSIENGRVIGIIFNISVNGIPMLFKLPAKTSATFKKLKSEVKRPKKDTFRNLEIQADKVAWKLLSEWVEIQLSMIQLEQAEFIEVFLPYAWSERDNLTLFERVKNKNYKLLTE
jgi:hypothetical protein